MAERVLLALRLAGQLAVAAKEVSYLATYSSDEQINYSIAGLSTDQR